MKAFALKDFFKKSFQLSLAACTLLIISCGGGDSSSSSSNTPIFPQPGEIDQDFIPFIESFAQELEDRGIEADLTNISMLYADDIEAAGICFVGVGFIQINSFFRRNRTNLLELVYHELGHCALGMEHRDNSIMQASEFIGVTDETLDEFFSEEFFFELDLTPRNSEVEVKTSSTLNQ